MQRRFLPRFAGHAASFGTASLTCISVCAGVAHAQAPPPPPAVSVNIPEVNASPPAEAFAAKPDFSTDDASLGPLGTQAIQNTPFSVTTVPEDLIVDTQTRTVNDTLRYLPSVEVRDQQGFEVSRPQSRGFMGSIVQNTRLDGLNIIGTTAIPAENLSGVQVLNGLAGALFGPESPAGVFDYLLRRPTDTPLYRYIEGYTSDGVFTEEGDVGGRAGPVGYRINVMHGQGEEYVRDSDLDRTLLSTDFDVHIDDHTVIEADYSHYSASSFGLPGSIVYGSGKSTVLPKPVDPTQPGIGQPNAGTNLATDTGLIKIKHAFNDNWTLEIGGLYQNADRNLFGITNTFTNNRGDFTVTKNFSAVPHFTVGSNEAYLNGHFDAFGIRNDLTIGTNGFINGQYNYRNNIATVLGKSSLADPLILPTKPIPYNGGQYEAAQLSEQSLIVGDTVHFTDQLALQSVLSTSFLNSTSYTNKDRLTSSDTENGVLSPSEALIYKPLPKLTTYASFALSIEQGDQAPTGTANQNAFLSPYTDRQYEIGAKYALTKAVLITLDGFRMTRPLAETSATTNTFAVVGTQRNWGSELFVQGELAPSLSLFGGVTFIDAELVGSHVAANDNKRVVGVPRWKSDISADYHPAVFRGAALTGSFNYESDRAATDSNNSFSSSYATLDLGARFSASYLSRHATLRFQVINVTDTRYYVSIADGNIVGSPGADTAYLGTPRTYLASLEFDL